MMICELIMIGTIAINPCQIEALEVSALSPQDRCVVLMSTGKRYTLPKMCTQVYEELSPKRTTTVSSEGQYFQRFDI